MNHLYVSHIYHGPNSKGASVTLQLAIEDLDLKQLKMHDGKNTL
jgi:hypothetical protein